MSSDKPNDKQLELIVAMSRTILGVLVMVECYGLQVMPGPDSEEKAHEEFSAVATRTIEKWQQEKDPRLEPAARRAVGILALAWKLGEMRNAGLNETAFNYARDWSYTYLLHDPLAVQLQQQEPAGTG